MLTIPAARAATNVVVVLEVENQVEIRRAGAQEWDRAYPGQLLRPGDSGRTRPNSRAMLQMYDLSRVKIGPDSVFSIEKPPVPQERMIMSLTRGVLYFFSRSKPAEADIRTPTASAAIRGTEFALSQDDQGLATLTLLDGEVVLSNPTGKSVTLRNREQGVVQPGKPPTKTAVIETAGIIQWSLYYPAVLDPDELALPAQARQELSKCLSAYRSGDLLEALTQYPDGRQPSSEAEKMLHAALLLSVGEVGGAEKMMELPAASTDERSARLAAAMRDMISVVKQPTSKTVTTRSSLSANPSPLTTELMVRSYRFQAEGKLADALEAARKAAENSPTFGFAWERVAELEFSFGRIGSTKAALEKSLMLSPRNAEALSLKGFVLSARGRSEEALDSFEHAIAVDGALGNAWLGRGLCLFHQGLHEAGRADLETAAALEPNRSFLRSYLGKGWAETGRDDLAARDFGLAKQLDNMDPTPWLYSALWNRDLNRFNPAVEELEESSALNENRQVYRSKFLLDQDRSIRSASLASIYREDGMSDLSLREAAHAVTADYANYSAHLFLANSFDALRDPTRYNLRYETPWFNELLLANLLAPSGAAAISPNISQQEYSRMFEQDHLGVASSFYGRSDGQYHEVASLFGSTGALFDKAGAASFSSDVDWQHNEGVRPNNELTRTEWYNQVKYAITPQDSIFFLTKYEDYHSGDNFQYFNPSQVTVTTNIIGQVSTNLAYRPHLTFIEHQQPFGISLGAYHHEWAPGIHTMAMVGHLLNDQKFTDQSFNFKVFSMNLAAPGSPVASVTYTPFDYNYRGQLETWIGELNQVVQTGRNTLVVGGRDQSGQFDTLNSLTNVSTIPGVPGLFPVVTGTGSDGTTHENMYRWTVYGYDTIEAMPEQLWLTAGLSYDHLDYPANFRQMPISGGRQTANVVGPKGAVVWSPFDFSTLRLAYSRSLGGVSLDESFRLEQPALAGFNQSYRTLINESVAGSVTAPKFETFGGALDFKFKTGTYIGLTGAILKQDVDQTDGVFRFPVSTTTPAAYASTTQEKLTYKEYSAGIVINQLLPLPRSSGSRNVDASGWWTLGASYYWTRSELMDNYPELSTTVFQNPSGFNQADLNTFSFSVLYNHRSGMFSSAEVDYYWQQRWSGTSSPTTVLPHDQFPQVNFWVGYRFRRSHGQIAIGVLNANNTDYRLDPLNPYVELPRSRVVAGQVQFRF